jgi:tripeptide aminopeptidase
MIQRERMVDTLIDLVKIDSHSKEELPVAQWLERELKKLGIETHVDDAGTRVGGNSGNIVARFAGTSPDAQPLLLSAHMDTVPPGKGVKPVRTADRIKTDGTTVLGGDDKSGLAVILEVLRTLKEKAVPHGDLEITFSICEEIGLLGAKNLDFAALRAREAIVLDSGHASICTTQGPSADRFEFIVHGLEAHAGLAPENGISAVRIAAEAIAAMPLGRIDPRTTSNVVIVEGGMATNVVPNRCVVRGEARSLDDATLDATTAAIRRSFQDAAARATATVDGVLHRGWIEEQSGREYESMHVPDSDPLVKALLAAATATGKSVTTASIGGGSDANVFNRRGIRAVNFGTGMREVHTVNEWLDLADFYACADVVLEFVRARAS